MSGLICKKYLSIRKGVLGICLRRDEEGILLYIEATQCCLILITVEYLKRGAFKSFLVLKT